ncbi:unnamed protein product [Phyllotreta striolata]|uniref:FUN14 domain-containing protein 1 n=1 Tax=Phyllotreta striolata TaxID=444603 RepID=A0A9N9TGB5_PHYSR|nr:unnamed protein product [Phyllotreta striolata]
MPGISRIVNPKKKNFDKAMDDAGKEAKSLIERILGDVSKTSATKQIVLGASSGWVTGFLAMRVGKTAALALGGGIILLQIANEKGYIKVNWDKVNRNLDKVADKVEEKITGESSTWADRADRFVDRKLNQAEDVLKKGQKKAKKWYYGENGITEMQIFILSFTAGVAIGVGCS